jgi:hypothetical protein
MGSEMGIRERIHRNWNVVVRNQTGIVGWLASSRSLHAFHNLVILESNSAEMPGRLDAQ